VAVAGKGRDKHGHVIYAVTSKSEAGRWHVVTVLAGRLTCDCVAASYSRQCCHRVAVSERITAERQYLRDLANEQNAACCGY
jgi:hypothetical protein